MRESLSVLVCFVLCVTTAAAQDSVLVVGSTVSSIDGSPLPYSTFSIEQGARRFANGDGSFSFRAKAGVPYRINVKQLGFSPLDTTITFGRVSPARVTLGLRGIVYRLAAVRTEVRHPCSAEIRGTELSAVLEQVRENAERDQLLRHAYPFEYKLERTRRLEWSGGTSRWVRDTASFLSTAIDPYRAGHVVRERFAAEGVGREMRIPQLADLADEMFLANHCFSYGGKHHLGDRIVYEIDFEPTRDLALADVRGAVLLDSASFQIHQAEFQLTRGDALDPPVTAFRVSTTYRDLAPGLRIVNDVHSAQDLAKARPTDSVERQMETQRLLDVHFLGDSSELFRATRPRTKPAN